MPLLYNFSNPTPTPPSVANLKSFPSAGFYLMKSNYLKLLTAGLLALFGGINPLLAEPASIRFRALAWNGEIDGIFYAHKGKAQEIVASDNIRSPFYPAAATPELVFFKEVIGAEGDPQREILGRVSTANLGSTILLLIAKNPNGSYSFSTAADDLSSFPQGSYRFMNASLTPLRVVAEAEQADLASGEIATLEPNIDPKTGGVLIRAITQSKPHKLLYSNRLAARAKQRTLVLAMDSGNPRRPVLVKRIMENSDLAAVSTRKDDE